MVISAQPIQTSHLDGVVIRACAQVDPQTQQLASIDGDKSGSLSIKLRLGLSFTESCNNLAQLAKQYDISRAHTRDCVASSALAYITMFRGMLNKIRDIYREHGVQLFFDTNKGDEAEKVLSLELWADMSRDQRQSKWQTYVQRRTVGWLTNEGKP